MKLKYQKICAVCLILMITVIVQIGAVYLVEPFIEEGYHAVEDPTDPVNGLIYLAMVLAFTAVLLSILKKKMDTFVRLLIIAMCGFISTYAFKILANGFFQGRVTDIIAIALAVGLSFSLYAYPEWYVIDIAGIIVSMSAAGIFGISFGPLPALILLLLLTFYDIVSVYRTKHMLTLAEEVGRLKLPLIFVVPLSWRYSFVKSEIGVNTEVQREAYFLGLGDLILPTIIVTSAVSFSEANYIFSALPFNFPAIGGMVGTIFGMAVLLWLVDRGKAHAGLPFLNGGAFLGYIAGSIISGIPLMTAIGL